MVEIPTHHLIVMRDFLSTGSIKRVANQHGVSETRIRQIIQKTADRLHRFNGSICEDNCGKELFSHKESYTWMIDAYRRKT